MHSHTSGNSNPVIHYGDTAYNMVSPEPYLSFIHSSAFYSLSCMQDDECGAVGDVFFNTVQSYSTQTPVVYSNGWFESHRL